MEDKDKTENQLIEELVQLRRHVQKLINAAAQRKIEEEKLRESEESFG